MQRFLRTSCLGALVVLVLVFWTASFASAVVILSGDGQGNTTEPAANPYWANVAQISSASTVYLGNRWMITANHVSGGPVRFTDGTTIQMVPGSEVRLTNPAGSGATGNADLRMFRIADDPGLPTLNIASTAPGGNTRVMMIGAGFDRNRNEIGFSIQSTIFGDIWRPAAMPLVPTHGFSLKSTAHMRWGYNTVDSSQLAVTNSTVTFRTTFDAAGPYEAQAVSGDSGGGVFERVGNNWILAGIMDTSQLISGQPTITVAFGNQSLSANLSTYRDQILSIMNRPDETAATQAALLAALQNSDVSPLTALAAASDLALTSPEAAAMLGQLTANGANPTTRTFTSLVPEPGTMGMAALGALLLGLAYRRANWRNRNALLG
jgi:hypothetical protein